MKSVIAKRSIVLEGGRKTSISMEDQFWAALKEIAAERQLTLSALVSIVDDERGDRFNLSSALRTFVLARYAPHLRLSDRGGKRRAIEKMDRARHSATGRVAGE
jgi:predicted DNA-binding ribbon-helix-helix protein